MNRKIFIRLCGFACLGTPGLLALLESCGSTRQAFSGHLEGENLLVPLNRFEAKPGGPFRKYLIVRHEALQYPICVYRFSEQAYTALLLRCPHQGAELQVFGDELQCPAHGSSFSNQGQVLNGPATASLRTFPVTVEQDQLKISLKK